METKIEYLIKGDLAKIKNNLTDLVLYSKFHPLILKVEKLNSSEEGILFQITERPYSFIPINIKYKALVTSHKNDIIYKISDIPLTKVFIKYQVEKELNGFIKIIFLLKIKSMPFVDKILLKKMIKAQNDLMTTMQLKTKSTQNLSSECFLPN